MINQKTIALIFDCDDTLCEDTTTFLLKELGIDAVKFWSDVDIMVRKGWDPPLAYMRRMLKLTLGGKTNLTESFLKKTGAKLPFFPGIPDLFDELRTYVSEIEEAKEANIKLEYYVVSSGFEQLVKGSKISPYVDDIFGCTFEVEEDTGILLFPKSTVTFTEKTKFLFAINKGISGDVLRKSPYEVNNSIPEKDRRIPFSNMLYIGDGPSDIPCLSVLMKNSGYGIGVYGKKTISKGWQLAKGQRMTVGPYPCDYSINSPLRTMIQRTVKEIALRIVLRQQLNDNQAPRY